MEWIHTAIDFVLHLNVHLASLVQHAGAWSYFILFGIIFAETGLVIMPFLPGDSLLFAAGSLSAISTLNVHLLAFLLTVAATLGNMVNYLIGRWFGHKLFANPDSKIFKRAYLEKGHAFYEKYGAYAVFISRFLPLIRTFVPFVAGMAGMNYGKYMFYNILGAICWVCLFIYGGFLFGQMPVVKNNFSLVIIGIIIVSVLPIAFEVLRHALRRNE
tara:strand:+ start:20242 stop:20886 length:645 start_codon:yes stop_codon:yes gene_type:complete